MNRFYNIAGILSGLIGSVTLVLLFFFVHEPIGLSLISGLVGFAGSFVLLLAFKPKEELSIELGNQISASELSQTLKQGDLKIKQLQYFEGQVTDPEVRKKLQRISAEVQDIYQIFKKDSGDIKYARQFLSYYLDSTINIINRYSELSAQHLPSDKMKNILVKAENMLDSIAIAFEKQKEKLLSNDIMDLDVEIQTLEKTFNAEDLK